jgi:hypothetical protein
MAKIVQLKWGGEDAYPQTITDAIAVVYPIDNENKETEHKKEE